MGVRTASRMRASGMAPERTLGPVDEFSLFVLFGFLVAVGVFLALGRWYPGSGAEQVDWRPTRSPEVEAELELDDVDQMLEAQNARRRASGRPERTEDDIRAQVAEDERWREELRRRAREGWVGRALIVGCGGRRRGRARELRAA